MTPLEIAVVCAVALGLLGIIGAAVVDVEVNRLKNSSAGLFKIAGMRMTTLESTVDKHERQLNAHTDSLKLTADIFGKLIHQGVFAVVEDAPRHTRVPGRKTWKASKSRRKSKHG